MNKNLKITIGADPEGFLLDENNQPYPIVGLLGGSKEYPLYVSKDEAFLEDNVMFEFNIKPSKSKEEFCTSINKMLGIIQESVKNINPNLKLDYFPAYHFKPEYLTSPQAEEFGCEPDFNAYTGAEQCVNTEKAGTLRTAGGHIHIGLEGVKITKKIQEGITRAFDMMVVLPFMLIEPENDRRSLYGSAGSMRYKSYGVECRQLSCFWLSSDELKEWVYERSIAAVYEYFNNEELHEPKNGLCQTVYNLIQSKNLDQIKNFVRNNCFKTKKELQQWESLFKYSEMKELEKPTV